MNNKPLCWSRLVSAVILIGATLVFSNHDWAMAAAKDKGAKVVIGKDNVVKLEVAQTEQQIEQGLMYRKSLADDRGMVFLFRPAQPVEFWMFHCFISLDMLFVRDGKIVKICADVPPCKAENPRECPRYGPGRNADISEVIEVAGGYAKRHNINEGDPVKFELP